MIADVDIAKLRDLGRDLRSIWHMDHQMRVIDPLDEDEWLALCGEDIAVFVG